jgi:acetolactate synthase-1/2/3 large subunit
MAQFIGGSNLAAALRDPYMAGSPVIALTGGPTPQSRYRHSYQEVEDFCQFAPVTKFSAQVGGLDRFPELLRQAFREATSGSPGPAHLQLPSRGGSLIGETEADLEPFVEEQFSSVPAFRPEPEMERVRAAAAVLTLARRPVIVAGGGVIRSGAEREVVELAEKLNIPVVSSLNAKAVIPDRHPLAVGVSGTYSRDCANRTLLEADLVFFIGSTAGGMTTHDWHFPPPGTPVIQLDINPSELGRVYRNTASILGDAKTSLRRLIDAVEPKPADSAKAWTARVRQLVTAWRDEAEPMRSSDAVPIRPERICKEITDALPPHGVLVSDTGHSGIWTSTMVELNHPTQRYIRCAGSLGWGFPGALGVKCALPDRPVLLFTGDGGFYYHIAELETARRHRINLVVVVNNNSSLNQEIYVNQAAYNNQPRGGWTDMWTFTHVDFARIAEGFGCVGIRVERPVELKGALERAFATDQPVVIDVATDVNAVAKRVAH